MEISVFILKNIYLFLINCGYPRNNNVLETVLMLHLCFTYVNGQMKRCWNLLLFFKHLIISDVNLFHVWPLSRGTVVIFQRRLIRKSQIKIKIKFSNPSILFEDDQFAL